MFKPVLSILGLSLLPASAFALECGITSHYKTPFLITSSVSDTYRSNGIYGTSRTAQYVAQCAGDRGAIDFTPSGTPMTLSCVRKNFRGKVVDEGSLQWSSGLLHGELDLRSRAKRLTPSPIEIRVAQTMEGSLAISIAVEADDRSRVSFHHDLIDRSDRRWNAAWTITERDARNPRTETVECTLVKN